MCCGQCKARSDIRRRRAALSTTTAFLSSKARGDTAIRGSGAPFQIFRPGLVLASNAYGRTVMLRMLAAFLFVQPIAVPDAQIQSVSLDDVATAVCAAIDGRIPNAFKADLVEPDPHSLREVLGSMRSWLGFGVARHEVVVPAFGTKYLCKISDALSFLGWRSPMRTTAYKVLTEGVTGKPVDLSSFGLAPISTFSQALEKMPARTEDRLFAGMSLVTPFLVITLVSFWLLSGVIGLARVHVAAATPANVGWPRAIALISVTNLSASLLDLVFLRHSRIYRHYCFAMAHGDKTGIHALVTGKPNHL
jgi:hypothetical protein